MCGFLGVRVGGKGWTIHRVKVVIGSDQYLARDGRAWLGVGGSSELVYGGFLVSK